MTPSWAFVSVGNRLEVGCEQWKRKCVCCKKRLSPCLKGNPFTRVSEEGCSVVQKGFVPSNTARCNEWALKWFWVVEVPGSCRGIFSTCRSDVLLTDDPKLLCSCLRKYVRNTAHCNKWALNNFEWWTSQVAVEEFFRCCLVDWWAETTLFLLL